MMKEKKLSQMILKLHDRAEAAKYDGDSSPPYQEVDMTTCLPLRSAGQRQTG